MIKLMLQKTFTFAVTDSHTVFQRVVVLTSLETEVGLAHIIVDGDAYTLVNEINQDIAGLTFRAWFFNGVDQTVNITAFWIISNISSSRFKSLIISIIS